MIAIWGHRIDALLWFCASGQSFFPGVALLLTAIAFSAFHGKLLRKILIYILVIIAIALIALSATGLPLWFYMVWFATLVCWLFILCMNPKPKILRNACIIIFTTSAIAVSMEIPFHLKPRFPEKQFENIFIIGDSVSAGIGSVNEQTWPKIIRKKYVFGVTDLSIAGATVSSALKRQVGQVESANAIVLLEIGGNDTLNSTPIEFFKRDLEEILKELSNNKRIIIMLELPLLPQHIRYGMIQRKLAKKYDVVLVPKRFLAGIFSSEGATVDLAHLSASGHELMAERIWNLVDNSLRSTEKQ
jgi:acyl-CoA thioesterase-1